jgi:riboflavin transporter FmnP
LKIETKVLAGTAILAALVFVLDYSMKASRLKIPFPWLPQLKFDFTGIPIALSLYLFGFVPGVFTSVIAFVVILARSGDIVGASMKAVAELSTVVGLAFALKTTTKFRNVISFASAITVRCFVMFLLNLLLFPVGISPLIAAFNVIQGSISILGASSLHEIIKTRAPSLIPKKAQDPSNRRRWTSGTILN